MGRAARHLARVFGKLSKLGLNELVRLHLVLHPPRKLAVGCSDFFKELWVGATMSGVAFGTIGPGMTGPGMTGSGAATTLTGSAV